MSKLHGNLIKAEPLTEDAFRPYGQVIEAAQPSQTAVSANQGTAKRRNWIGKLENLRPNAKPNIVGVRPVPSSEDFQMKLLERHSFSTQAFIPMSSQDGTSTHYLVIVCLNGQDDTPDFSSLKCFVAKPFQGVNYVAGCWHHPIVALDKQVDFTCLVWEDGTLGDCEEYYFNQKVPGKFDSDVILVQDLKSAAALS